MIRMLLGIGIVTTIFMMSPAREENTSVALPQVEGLSFPAAAAVVAAHGHAGLEPDAGKIATAFARSVIAGDATGPRPVPPLALPGLRR